MENILGDGIGSIELIDSMGKDLTVVNAARVSFGKRKDLLDKEDETLISYLAEHNHTTPFEHGVVQFHVKCPLFVRAQWMRHRTWSYNEISRRYTSENIEFYVPDVIRCQDTKENLQGSDGELSGAQSLLVSNIIAYHSSHALSLYEKLLDQNVANEMARMILPQNMYTEFIATVDIHNLAHFLKLRLDTHAQQEIRLYAEAIVELVKPLFPNALGALLK